MSARSRSLTLPSTFSLYRQGQDSSRRRVPRKSPELLRIIAVRDSNPRRPHYENGPAALPRLEFLLDITRYTIKH